MSRSSNTGSGELHAATEKSMQDANTTKMTVDLDKDFARLMAQHHQQAIETPSVLQKHGKSAELKRFQQGSQSGGGQRRTAARGF